MGNTVVTFPKLDFLQKSHLRIAFNLDSESTVNSQTTTASSSISPTTSPPPPPHPILDTIMALAKARYPNLEEDYLSKCINLNLKNLVLPESYLEQMIYMFTPSVSHLYSLPPALKVSKRVKTSLYKAATAWPTNTSTTDPVSTPTEAQLPKLLLPLLSNLARIPTAEWTLQRIQEVFPHGVDKTQDYAGYQRHIAIMQFLRLALAGGMHGPGIPETIEVLGREWAFLRFREALDLFSMAEADKSGELLEVVEKAAKGNVLTSGGEWS